MSKVQVTVDVERLMSLTGIGQIAYISELVASGETPSQVETVKSQNTQESRQDKLDRFNVKVTLGKDGKDYFSRDGKRVSAKYVAKILDGTFFDASSVYFFAPKVKTFTTSSTSLKGSKLQNGLSLSNFCPAIFHI